MIVRRVEQWFAEEGRAGQEEDLVGVVEGFLTERGFDAEGFFGWVEVQVAQAGQGGHTDAPH